MSETVIITLITVVGGGLLTILGTLVAKINNVGRRVNQVGKDAAVARDQTQNNHKSNLRDDIDEKHTTVTDSLSLILGTLRGLQESDRLQWTAINNLNQRKE